MTAFIDVYSRKIVGWGLSNTMSKKWCLEVLKDAIQQHGKPLIINSDQGSQYTSSAWTHFLEDQQIKISMDGKGRATDNTWIDRFWKTLKYDYVYLNPCDNGGELLKAIQNHIDYYNQKKHQATRMSPQEAYTQSTQNKAA